MNPTSNDAMTKTRTSRPQDTPPKKAKLCCPRDNRYYIELDAGEAFPDEPGQGAPAMVYGPRDTSGTFFCVTDTGWLNEGDKDGHELPSQVMAWLESQDERVDHYVTTAFATAADSLGSGIHDFTVETNGAYGSDGELHIEGCSLGEDHLTFLLQHFGVLRARDQNGTIIEMWLDMDGETLVPTVLRE